MYWPLSSSLTSMHLLRKALLAFLTMLLFLNFPALGSQQNERKKVLVLYSFRSTQPVASEWDKGIRSVFESNISHKMGLNIEYLDLMHYDDDRLIQLLLDVYRYKYSKPKPDLIIPVFNSAVDLVLKHGPDSFPGVPIVFGGVESKFIENRSLGPHITGYLTDNNYTGTLDLALNLHPDTRHVVVVAGAGPIGRGWSKACREAFKAYEERVNLTYLIGLPLEPLLEKVANLSAHTVVISIPINIDGAGKRFFGNESLSHITRAANAPVYSFWDVTVGTGIVGGYVSSFEEQGKAVAQLGLRILNGEQPEDIPITKASPFLYMFDWRQLKRWSIAEDRLPPGSIVKFKHFTFWDMYKGRIIVVFALLFFQVLIISYLLHQRRIRSRTEEKLLQAEQKYRTVADYTYDWEYWQNPDGSLQYVSPSCERICGYTVQDLIAKPALLQDMILNEDKAVWDEHKCSVQQDLKAEEIQFRIQRPDGEIRWIEHACQPVFDHKGKNKGVRASNRDITIRKQSEDSLKASREEAGLLAGKLLNAQELERARVARELHDDISQRLAALNIEVDKLEMQDQSLTEPLKEKLRQLGTNLGELSSDVHMISRQLHPSILYDLGLIKAIETECNSFTRLRGISPTLDMDITIKEFPKAIALCIYRILQEGLRNIGKHAKASDIQVRLFIKYDTICLFLKDNGIGFDSASAKKRAGIGVASMVERARLVNGDLSIESGPEKGTTLKLKIPVTPRDN